MDIGLRETPCSNNKTGKHDNVGISVEVVEAELIQEPPPFLPCEQLPLSTLEPTSRTWHNGLRWRILHKEPDQPSDTMNPIPCPRYSDFMDGRDTRSVTTNPTRPFGPYSRLFIEPGTMQDGNRRSRPGAMARSSLYRPIARRVHRGPNPRRAALGSSPQKDRQDQLSTFPDSSHTNQSTTPKRFRSCRRGPKRLAAWHEQNE